MVYKYLKTILLKEERNDHFTLRRIIEEAFVFLQYGVKHSIVKVKNQKNFSAFGDGAKRVYDV